MLDQASLQALSIHRALDRERERERAGERASERAILNLVSHYMATGPALLNVTDPFTVLGLVEPLRCPIVALVLWLWGPNDREARDGKGQQALPRPAVLQPGFHLKLQCGRPTSNNGGKNEQSFVPLNVLFSRCSSSKLSLLLSRTHRPNRVSPLHHFLISILMFLSQLAFFARLQLNFPRLSYDTVKRKILIPR